MNPNETSSHVVDGTRRLAAILAADIVGYSKLMGRDEEGTLARVKRHRREIVDPTLVEHHGRLIKNTGDGFLAMFDSPLEAVRCAIVIQQMMRARNTSLSKEQWLQYRMGVNLGDVIVDSDDIYGDGVNIAARLESLADPGGVYISGGVYEQIKNKLVCGYQSLGDEKLKNITDPVRIYRVLPDPAAVARVQGRKWLRPALSAVGVVALGLGGWLTLRSVLEPRREERPALAVQAPPQQPIAQRAPASPAQQAAEPVQPRPAPVNPAPVASAAPATLPGLPPPPAPPPEVPNIATAPLPTPAPLPERAAAATVASTPAQPEHPPAAATPLSAPPERPAAASHPAPELPAPAAAASPAAAPPTAEHAGAATPPAATPPAASPPPQLRAAAPAATPEASAPPAQAPAPAAAAPQSPTQVAVLVPPVRPDRPAPSGPYPTFRDCAQCPEMVKLPGGSFSMGSREDSSEAPIHQVAVRAFAIGRFAVTVGEWKQCVAAKACAYQPTGGDDLPVYNVSWADAQQYVAWLSQATQRPYRLPSEAEWEYAARGGTSTKYYWGNQLISRIANCKGCGEPYDSQQPVKVGSFAPNPFGLHDMAGGVDQWVADCWHKNYSGAPRDGSSWEAQNCRERVLRGGSWKNDPATVRPAARNFYDPNVRYPSHGFRVARSD
jgi:formylglycine-generating enzyme required for sulfatase activity/class 3 adenylate cyclase